MKAKRFGMWVLLLGILVALVGTTGVYGAYDSTSAGTAFTYQGRLTDGSSPANGAYDFQFNLFDDATAGNQVGNTVALEDVTVTEGLFTVQLDFGSSAFDGGARYLEIGV